jgi:hypothetical protein
MLFALSAFGIREILVNEAGSTAPVIGYEAGIFLWVGSSIVLLVTSLLWLGARSLGK